MNMNFNNSYQQAHQHHHADCVDDVIRRLKIQGSLRQDLFVESPYNMEGQKESQLRELFQDVCNPQNNRVFMEKLISMSQDPQSLEILAKHFSSMQMMGFAQLILYKVLPCPDENCPNKPRIVATRNQYRDFEYQCPFYHHDKDRRRLVIPSTIGEEFLYKANYFIQGKTKGNKEEYSQNYFESMFHPLYYKMFQCKREYCNSSSMCPFFHTEDEKNTYEKVFSNFMRKDKKFYAKEKAKPVENRYNQKQNQQNLTQHVKANPNFDFTLDMKINNKKKDEDVLSTDSSEKSQSPEREPVKTQEEVVSYYNPWAKTNIFEGLRSSDFFNFLERTQ
jgi:hypothetical protein